MADSPKDLPESQDGNPAQTTQLSSATAARTEVTPERTVVQSPPSTPSSGGATLVLGGETTVAVGGTEVSAVADAPTPALEDEASDDLDVGDVLKDRFVIEKIIGRGGICLLYTSPSPRDATLSRMPSSA